MSSPWRPSPDAADYLLHHITHIAAADLLEDDRWCPICYVKYEEAEGEEPPENGVKISPCGHTFGERCIKAHLGGADEYARFCPICRLELIQKQNNSLLLLAELHSLELSLPFATSDLERLIAPEFGAEGPRRYAEMALINLRRGMDYFAHHHPRAHIWIGYAALEAYRYWPDNQEVKKAATEVAQLTVKIQLLIEQLDETWLAQQLHEA